MSQFVKSFDIRWNDLDPNRHVANTTFLALMTETRMSYLTSHGFGLKDMARYNIGPVIFTEEIHYLREVHANERVHVDMELVGLSEDGRFFRFAQHLYNNDGDISAYFEVTGAWMDLGSRKLIAPPEELMSKVGEVPKSDHFRTLTNEDTRRLDPAVMQRKLEFNQE